MSEPKKLEGEQLHWKSQELFYWKNHETLWVCSAETTAQNKPTTQQDLETRGVGGVAKALGSQEDSDCRLGLNRTVGGL